MDNNSCRKITYIMAIVDHDQKVASKIKNYSICNFKYDWDKRITINNIVE